MPPISCTSKWRWPRVRLAASRTVAKAGTRRSSSVGAGGELGAELGGAGAELVVGERVELGLQRVDRGDRRRDSP